jgi:GNAT superfamily N-acetyltransferase
MVDHSVPFYDLFMLFRDLSHVQDIPLIGGYSFRYFDGTDSDIRQWAEIVASSGDVPSIADAYKGFETYFRPHIDTLSKRCIFLLSPEDEPIGTATAFFLVPEQPGLPEIAANPEAMPPEVTGHLHWVAIREEHKRKGLSKPMIARAMRIMYQLGHKAAFLHTQTPSWLAAKIYLDLGWEPFRFVQSDENFAKGWGIVRDKIAGLN